MVLIPWCSSLTLTPGAAFTPLFYRSLLGRAQRTGAFDIPWVCSFCIVFKPED
jgi:hypothetical protein